MKKIDKYCLKGEYYDAFEKIDYRLQFMVPRSFRKEVDADLLDLFYRNQNMGNNLKEAIGVSVDSFIRDILESYYSTLGTRRFLNYFFQQAFLGAMLASFFYIMNSWILGNTEPISSATIFSGIIGFIMGAVAYYLSHKFLYKKSVNLGQFLQMMLLLMPMYIMNFFHEKVYEITKGINISYFVVIVFLIIEIVGYIALVFSYKLKEKSDSYVR